MNTSLQDMSTKDIVVGVVGLAGQIAFSIYTYHAVKDYRMKHGNHDGVFIPVLFAVGGFCAAGYVENKIFRLVGLE